MKLAVNQPPMTPMTQRHFDPVSGMSLSGGIPRMGDIDSNCPSPRTMERRRRRAETLAKFQSDAADAAKANRHRYNTNVSYTPATNSIFSQQVQMLVNAAEATAKQHLERQSTAANAEPNDVLPKDVPTIVLAMQSIRIQLIVDPVLSVQELTAFCTETSRNEALAAANPANSVEFARLKQLRMELEAEVHRCMVRTAKPTPHVRIARVGHSSFLGNILTRDTMNRTFVSMTDLIAAVSADIGQFIASPTRSRDRITVLRGENTVIG